MRKNMLAPMRKLYVYGFGFMVALLAMVLDASAQSTGTNTTTLIADNISNASNVLTPIAIGIAVIWIVWWLIKKIGSKAA